MPQLKTPEQIPERGNFLTRLWDPRTARVLYTLIVFALSLAFLRSARETITLFLFAILFAYFLAPLVGWIEGPVRGRGRAIFIVYLLLAAVLTLVGLIAGPRIADEGRSLTTSLPTLFNQVASGQLIANISKYLHLGKQNAAQLQGFMANHHDEILAKGKDLGEKLAAPAQKVWWLILIPILTLFFLKEGQEMAARTVALGRHPDERSMIQNLLDDVNVMLGSYIRSQIILSGLTMFAYTLVLSLMRVPYAFVLGPVAGLLEFVPVVGPAIAATAVVIIAAVSGYSHIVWLIVFLGVWRLQQDYLSAPRIMGDSLEIDPLLQIFAVLAGAEIDGVIGALISVPVVAILRIIWKRAISPEAETTTSTVPVPAPATQV